MVKNGLGRYPHILPFYVTAIHPRIEAGKRMPSGMPKAGASLSAPHTTTHKEIFVNVVRSLRQRRQKGFFIALSPSISIAFQGESSSSKAGRKPKSGMLVEIEVYRCR
jgi:hypothetical protein